MNWLFLTRPVDRLVGLALRARVAAHRDVPAVDSDSELLNELLDEEEVTEEVEVVARAFDPAIWRGFDAYVRKLRLNADEQAGARRHPHGPTLPSLRGARRAIAALDEFRSKQSRRD
jgi:hypothetical protein